MLWWVMSLLDDFVRMRRHRNRAAEFDELADTERPSLLGCRYRTIARHYKELADREERHRNLHHTHMLKVYLFRTH